VTLLNPELPGAVFAPTRPYSVSREKVGEFARAVGASGAIHHDVDAAREAGYADVVAPPTFTAVAQADAVRDLLHSPVTGLDPALHVVVHTTERIECVRPIVAGDELSTQLTVTSVASRGGADFVNTCAEIRDTEGELVATVTSSLLVGEQQ
jgi:acyl dehydratase